MGLASQWHGRDVSRNSQDDMRSVLVACVLLPDMFGWARIGRLGPPDRPTGWPLRWPRPTAKLRRRGMDHVHNRPIRLGRCWQRQDALDPPLHGVQNVSWRHAQRVLIRYVVAK